LKASSNIEITGNIYGPDNVSGIVTYGGTNGLGAYTQLFGGAHAVAPDQTINYSSRFRVNRLSDSATLLDVNGTAGTAFIKGQTTLGPHNTEGGELVWQTAAGATGYTIDVDASGNLRIRDTTSVKILITAAGGIQLPGALEGTTRPAATAIGDIWVDTTDPANGTLKKRLT
jgi:hypothetical protein